MLEEGDEIVGDYIPGEGDFNYVSRSYCKQCTVRQEEIFWLRNQLERLTGTRTILQQKETNLDESLESSGKNYTTISSVASKSRFNTPSSLRRKLEKRAIDNIRNTRQTEVETSLNKLMDETEKELGIGTD